MPERAKTYRPAHLKRRAPESRPDATERGYDRRWKRMRLMYLNEHPLCASCEARGLVVEATEVDHIDEQGPRGGRGYDESNLMAMCKPCHSRKTRASHKRNKT